MFRRDQESSFLSVMVPLSMLLYLLGLLAGLVLENHILLRCIKTSVLVPQHHPIDGGFLPLILKNGKGEIGIIAMLVTVKLHFDICLLKVIHC